jgi:alpha-ketoglutarate-dependent taurine dioxygenase
MRLEPLGPGAAEIDGLDLARPLADPAALRCAFALHPILVFRRQQLTPPQFSAFARHFGALETYEAPPPGSAPPVVALRETSARATPDQRLYACPDDSAVLLMTNETLPDLAPLAVIDNAETWHADGAHKPAPYDAVALHVVRNPAAGGETEFCDLSALVASLPAAAQAALRKAVGVHHWSKTLNPRFAASLDAAARAEGERVAAAVPAMRHPLVCLDEPSGRPHLFLSPRFTLAIDGLAPELSAALLEDLFAMMDDPRFVYAHIWREGDVAIWDNRRTNHRVKAYAAEDVRSRYRITVSGRGPMRPFAQAA